MIRQEEHRLDAADAERIAVLTGSSETIGVHPTWNEREQRQLRSSQATDELLDDNHGPHTLAAEEAHHGATYNRHQQIDDLDARLEQRRLAANRRRHEALERRAELRFSERRVRDLSMRGDLHAGRDRGMRLTRHGAHATVREMLDDLNGHRAAGFIGGEQCRKKLRRPRRLEVRLDDGAFGADDASDTSRKVLGEWTVPHGVLHHHPHPFFESPPGGMQTVVDRRQRQIEKRRDLCLRAVVNIAEDGGFAQAIREPGEGGKGEIAPPCSLDRLLGRHPLVRNAAGLRAGLQASPAKRVQRLPVDNAAQPRGKHGEVEQLWQVAPGDDEAVLHDVPGEVGIVQHGDGGSMGKPLIALDELREGVDVASAGPHYQRHQVHEPSRDRHVLVPAAARGL